MNYFIKKGFKVVAQDTRGIRTAYVLKKDEKYVGCRTEGLSKKLIDPAWKPDFGPAEFNNSVKKSGATAISARDFLVAYNINLNTKDKRLATDIAFDIRELGRSKRKKT